MTLCYKCLEQAETTPKTQIHKGRIIRCDRCKKVHAEGIIFQNNTTTTR